MILVGTPSWGRVTAETAMSVARDVGAGLVLADWKIVISPYVHHNRNDIWAVWQKSNAEHLLMVDDDVSWGSGVLDQLARMCKYICFVDLPIKWNETTGFNIVAGVYNEAPYSVVPQYTDAFASAMVMFSRAVLEDVGSNPWNLLISEGNLQLNEDLSFCRRLRRKPLCVPKLDVIHHRTMKLRPRDE